MVITEVIRKKAAKRIIGHIQGKEQGPTMVFFGGIHGNEPSGVDALREVFKEFEAHPISVKGSMYGIQGNMPALLQKQRFLARDLNRLWTKPEIERIKALAKDQRMPEDKELLELLELLNAILENETGPFYFIDFHTTSSRTLPFITINDAMINRKFSKLFPVPIILGIEEYLEGPLLSYINTKGYLSLGFESGQHFTEEARINSVAFIWLSLQYSGFLKEAHVASEVDHFSQLQSAARHNRNFYEVIERHGLEPEDKFSMKSGFESFSKIEKNTLLASHNGKTILASQSGILFMPLYQTLGGEGFFIVRRIPKSILRISAFVRKIKADRFLTLLPGVSWADASRERLMVNLKVARFFSKAFFHLMGYRNRVVDKTHILMNNREKTAKNEMYEDSHWY
jgi:predicted deacylase